MSIIHVNIQHNGLIVTRSKTVWSMPQCLWKIFPNSDFDNQCKYCVDFEKYHRSLDQKNLSENKQFLLVLDLHYLIRFHMNIIVFFVFIDVSKCLFWIKKSHHLINLHKKYLIFCNDAIITEFEKQRFWNNPVLFDKVE